MSPDLTKYRLNVAGSPCILPDLYITSVGSGGSGFGEENPPLDPPASGLGRRNPSPNRRSGRFGRVARVGRVPGWVGHPYLWRTRNDFCICDAGDNHLLFTFELESDLEKVLLQEPWSFDRHLVVLQKYDATSPMEQVDFLKSSFWIQIHNLPLTCLTPDVAMEIGESLGDVRSEERRVGKEC